MKTTAQYFVKRRNDLISKRNAVQEQVNFLRDMLSKAENRLRFYDNEILENEKDMPMSMHVHYTVNPPMPRKECCDFSSFDDFYNQTL